MKWWKWRIWNIRKWFSKYPIGTRVTITRGKYQKCSGVVKGYRGINWFVVSVNSGRGTHSFSNDYLGRKDNAC